MRHPLFVTGTGFFVPGKPHIIGTAGAGQRVVHAVRCRKFPPVHGEAANHDDGAADGVSEPGKAAGKPDVEIRMGQHVSSGVASASVQLKYCMG